MDWHPFHPDEDHLDEQSQGGGVDHTVVGIQDNLHTLYTYAESSLYACSQYGKAWYSAFPLQLSSEDIQTYPRRCEYT